MNTQTESLQQLERLLGNLEHELGEATEQIDLLLANLEDLTRAAVSKVQEKKHVPRR